MRLIKSLFVAITAMIMTTIAGSAITHLFEETKDAQHISSALSSLTGNIAHAEETDYIEDDTQQDASHTFTTSLNTYTPSTVIDETDLPTPLNNTSQSPSQEEQQDESVYVDILADLVPISGEDINYEKVLGISEEEIKKIIEQDSVSIWTIAEEADETKLLEDVYYAIYPKRIIGMLNQGTITQDMADSLIEASIEDIKNHQNTSIEEMINNMILQD